MSTEASSAGVSRPSSATDILLDGLFTGMIGAILVAGWFLVLDVIWGRPFYTPALLGSVLLHGAGTLGGEITIAPLEIATFTAFHFIAFVALGLAFSYLMNVLERFPIVFFVILVLFLSLQVGFFVLDAALGARLTVELQSWAIIVANVLAAIGMALYQWKRHPTAFKRIDKLWEDPEDKP